ncbi:hypothetical protein VPH35_041773 [Triticum aestivum]
MDHLAGASVSSADDPAPSTGNDGGLLDVIRAVERAEGTIRDQLQENSRLKEELMKKTRLLQRVSEDAASQATFGAGASQEPRASVVAGKMDGPNKPYDGAAPANPRGASALRQNGVSESGGDPLMHQQMRHNKYLDSGQANGAFRREPAGMDNGGPSHFSTPSSRSVSPARPRKEADYDSRLNLPGQGLLPVSEMNSNMSWKQDLTVKVKEHEEEITVSHSYGSIWITI